MTVRKKSSSTQPKGDMIPLPSRLEKVIKGINRLIEEEPQMENETPNKPETTKKAAKKVTKKATDANGQMVTLADLCKPLKMKPRMARRALRVAKVKNPGRWAWPKGKVPSIITKTLKAAVEASA